MPRRHKSIFKKEMPLWTDTVQDKRKKIARMQFNDEIVKLENGLMTAQDFQEAIQSFDKFRARIRRIVTRL